MREEKKKNLRGRKLVVQLFVLRVHPAFWFALCQIPSHYSFPLSSSPHSTHGILIHHANMPGPEGARQALSHCYPPSWPWGYWGRMASLLYVDSKALTVQSCLWGH